jgi:putative flippase GtrA
MRSKSESTKRFFVASGLTNILAYMIFVSIEYVYAPSEHVVSLIFASLAVLPLSYVLNRAWVFQSKNNLAYEMSRYTLVYGMGLTLSSILLYSLLGYLDNVYIAQFVSMIIMATAALTAHTFWTFIKK